MAAEDPVGGAAAIAAQAPGDAGAAVLAVAGQAFTDAMGVALMVAAALAAVTALLVARLLPSREPAATERPAGRPAEMRPVAEAD